MGKNIDCKKMFDLSGKAAAVTGAAGVLCGEMAKRLAYAGVKVALLDRNEQKAVEIAKEINEMGYCAAGIGCDVLNKESMQSACDKIIDQWGRVDILINGAGGNHKNATASAELSFFDLPADAARFVFDLNFLGTFLPCQVFGKLMAKQGQGQILNISSMNAFRPLTRIPCYSAAKAAISNFTQWLAVHMAMEYSAEIRVNAVAPGFFLTDQNRFLLTDEKSGELTERGKKIIAHTPMGRFGSEDELTGTVVWLVSDAAKFVTGIVVPVDGGFSAYSGV